MPKLTATFLYYGHSDFWGGNSERWDNNNGCLFAYYNQCTTLKDLIDQLVDDFSNGGDCEKMHEEITDADVRETLIMDMLDEQGRKDYKDGALSEFAVEFADINGLEAGVENEDEFDEYPVVIILLKSEAKSNI